MSRATRLLCRLTLLVCVTTTAAVTQSVVERCEPIKALHQAAKYDDAAALAGATLADVEKEFGTDSLEAAEVLHHLVRAFSWGRKARDPETLTLAERALAIRRALGDAREIADSLLLLGTVQWRLDQYDTARRTLQEALDAATDALGPDDLLVASILENLGILDWTTGDYGEARGFLEQTLRIRESRLDPGDDRIGRTLNNLAILHYEMGNYPLARQMYERSLRIREVTLGMDHPDTADVIDNLALVLTSLGEDPEARVLMERALAIRERAVGPEHPLVAISLINVGEALRSSGELDRALRVLQRALSINEKAYGDMHRRVATSLETIARVQLDLGRYNDARLSAERALDVRERITPGDVRLSDAVSLLGAARAAQGDLQAAIGLGTRAVQVVEQSLGGEHPRVATKLTGLAWLQVKVGDLEGAGKSLERAVAIRETQLGVQHPDVALALGPLAFLQWQQGLPDRARASASRAGAMQDAALRSTLQDLPEQQALYLAGRSVEPEVVLFSGLTQTGDGADVWLPFCWDWALRRRGLVFDELARRQQAALVSASPEMRAAWDRLAEARRRLAALWIRGPGEGDPKKNRDLIAAATDEKKTAETALARLTLQRTAEAPPGREEVKRALPQDAVLVEVVRVDVIPPRSRERTRQDIALILNRDGRMDFVRLGPSQRIDRLVESWRQALETGIDRIVAGGSPADTLDTLARSGTELRQAVWDPIVAKIGKASTIFLVPDGALHRVDLRALPLKDGRYLIESARTIHLLSTGRDLVKFSGNGGAKAIATGGMLALGSPDFGSDPATRMRAAERFRAAPTACLDLTEGRWPPLPQSGLEVREIAALAPPGTPVRVATGVEASEELFRREAGKHDALHIATHGFFATEECAAALTARPRLEVGLEPRDAGIVGGNPLLLSGLVLAGAGRSGDASTDDGILTGEEIAGLDLTGVRLAVLSACETGQGKVAVAEGVFGLRRALEMAGVRTVVMSLWRVPDRQARLWMETFYTRLFAGAPPEQAAQAATLKSLRSLRERRLPTHPYLWSGFVVAGDWH